MFYEKRYLQFNNLVFDGFDMISDYDEPIQYKGSSTAYSYGHGSYRPLKSNYLYVSERQVNMTIALKLKKVPCEYRQFYARFAEQELSRPGRLWAIKNNEIIWAWAVTNNARPIQTSRQDYLEWDMEFVIPGGVWHKADLFKTFVLPYDVCTLMDCKGFKKYDPCEVETSSGDCCEDCLSKNALATAKSYEDSCYCCCVDELCNDMALCYHKHELQDFYSCDTPYQFVYDCEKAKFYAENEYLGDKICTKGTCSHLIVGRFYSNTDIPTENVSMYIKGNMLNPIITINGNTNVIKGEYEGLHIKSDGSVYSVTECCEDLLNPSVWEIPHGQDFGWTIYPQENKIMVNMNTCCTGCVYISHDAITT